MEGCIFCKIAEGKIPATLLYQDSEVVAFRDIHPEAPVHVLIIPRKHIPSVADLTGADVPIIGKMVLVASKLAVDTGVSESGYRLIINNGPDGGMVVRHLHMHLLGGRKLLGMG